jgi:signal transduction histidine kinase
VRRGWHTLRGRLTITAVLSAALALVVLTVAFNVLLRDSLRSDLESRLHSRANAALATVRPAPGGLTVTESAGDAALDDGTWVYEGRRALERPRAGAALQAAADALAAGPRRHADQGEESRLYAIPVVVHGRRLGTVVAAVSLSAYRRTTRFALVGSALFALAVLLAVAGVAWAITGAALRPVGEMTEQAEEWSDRDLDQRFGAGDRPDELGRLAATFDALLDRIAASLRQEQRLSAELSHELRTPLAKVLAETELLLRRERPADEQREALEVIRRGAQRMTDILETLLAAARSEAQGGAPGRGDARLAVERAAVHARTQARELGVEVQVTDGAPTTVGVEAEIVERIVTPIVDNAIRHARAQVWIDVERTSSGAEVRVRDDGAGVAPADAERIFEPGVTSGPHGGSGLGLALSRRLARAAGGDVWAIPGAGGAFHLELPAG